MDFIANFPDDAAELAGDGDFDFIMMHEAFAEVAGAEVEPILCLPGFFDDPSREACLSGGEMGSDARFFAVVGGAFDHDPAGV